MSPIGGIINEIVTIISGQSFEPCGIIAARGLDVVGIGVEASDMVRGSA